MIVRIMGEGQYRVQGEALLALDEADNHVLEAVGRDDEDGFRRAYRVVVEIVQGQGVPLGDTELEESDLILPAPDTGLNEARELFGEYPETLA